MVLQVLFDHALTSSVILYNKSRDVFTMAETSRAIVRDVTLFERVLLDWRVWQNANTKVRQAAVTSRRQFAWPGSFLS